MELQQRLSSLADPTSPTYELATLFDKAGYDFHLVGGSVRDAILGEESYDIDICTNARPKEILELLSGVATDVWRQGEAFGTIGARFKDHDFEITTYRQEIYRDDSRKPEVEFGDSLETDLSRRDFTINAMAFSLPKAQLVDPYNGLDDLINKRLRTPLSPEISFSDDPLRMMRAARFIARFSCVPDDQLVQAVNEMRERLGIVSSERIRDELCKLLVVPDPSPGLYFLSETKLADEFLPELNAMSLEQDPIHTHKDVLVHTIAVVANTRPELRVRLAALMHDIAKPATRQIGDHGVSFHHHEVVGAKMTRKRMKALAFSKEMISEVSQLVFLHLRIHTYAMGWSDSAVRRYVRDAGDLLDDLNHLQRCDCTTRNKRRAEELKARMDALEERIAELSKKEELKKIRPHLDGAQVMKHLDVKPGPIVGRALDYLLEHRLENGPIAESEAYVLLDDWAKKSL
ncbi:MAG TPA: CCA tRNA nucleotidyltransferase [Acidimicrobiia bacterium]|nr:CCA tRNA nucleotidyltransferase [Acidimicrobiia bacterium]